MLSELSFFAVAALTLVAAICAMRLRNLVHCALCGAAAFAGLAITYLQLDAEFVGFAQILVYVGAVAILIVFAVLLTRGSEIKSGVSTVSSSWLIGVLVAVLVLASIVFPILNSPTLLRNAPANVQAPVKNIGEALMTTYVLPLETIALLLTAALIGAVVIAMRDDPEKQINTHGAGRVTPCAPPSAKEENGASENQNRLVDGRSRDGVTRPIDASEEVHS